MSKIQVFIDGKPVIADSGQTILQVCKDQGIEIPTLCYDDQLEPFTSCFLCVVEVEGARSFVPACGTKIYPGMSVSTNSEKIKSARKMALELILSNHYADCLGPCKITCPAGVDVQGYLALASMGRIRDAVELIKRNNPLPTVCGRVCTRPCEMNCRRNLVDEPAAIDHVKRYIADEDLGSVDRYFPDVLPENGKKVAIVGAGPAGLSCAYYLRQEGYTVDIFDAKPKAGGMLRWGIPQYRLPEEVLDREIEGITELGVQIHLNKALGRDFSLDSLVDDGYKSVFLGLGAQASSSMRVENEDAEGILSGIDFLEDVKLKKVDSISGKVGVVGGGNTAMDAARTALRLGADEVNVVYRRTRKEMPANDLEIEEADEEGINFIFLTAPTKVVLDGKGKPYGLECVKMELGPPDDSGRRRPVPIEGSNFIMELDHIVAAIGQKPDLEFAAKDSQLVNIAQTRWGTLELKSELMETNIPGVFSGGDVVLGPATAVEAIADGRKAAETIHKYISGEKLAIGKKPFISTRDSIKPMSEVDFEDVPKTTRAKMAMRDPEVRKTDWQEIELGFTPDQVYNEAIRCLECGCQAFYDCDLQRHSTEYEAIQGKYSGDFHDEKPDESHPFIQIELNKCVQCGRCVRICDEVMGVGVYGFVKRGYEAKVKPILEMPLAETDCISCGQCVETCPTGAIIDKVDATKPGPWILDQYDSVCNYCSVGCELQADLLEDRILKISAKKEADVNPFGNLCIKGRYGFRYVNDENRITTPQIRKNGKLEAVSWTEAINFVADRIKSSDGEWAVFGSPYATNEENYLLQKFARTALKTNHVGSLSNLKQYPEPLLRASMSNTTFDDVKDSDFIFVCDFDPMESHPVLYVEIQKAVRNGQAVYISGAAESKLAKKAEHLPVNEENKLSFIKYVIDSIYRYDLYDKIAFRTNREKCAGIFEEVANISHDMELNDFGIEKDQFDAFIKKLVEAENPVFVCNRDKASAENIHWLNTLAFVLGHSEALLSMPAAINYQGMLDTGLNHEYLPGYQRIDNQKIVKKFNDAWDLEVAEAAGLPADDAFNAFKNGEISNAIIWAQDPAGTELHDFSKTDSQFLVVAEMFMTKTAEMADVVFPIVPFFESNGSITNAEGKIQKFNAVVKSHTGRANWTIITELAEKLDLRFKVEHFSDIHAELKRIIPEYQKPIALFRNGYLPENEILALAKTKNSDSRINTLENWFTDFHAKNNMSPKKITV